MAEEQKPVEVVKDAPVAETPVETKPVEAAAAEEKPAAAEEKPVEAEAPAADAVAEASDDKAVEAKKDEEVKPVEEGTLEHKGAGANFPKNLYYSKQPFWFGNEAIDKKNLTTYLRHEKATSVAHHNASWAQATGQGLLLFGDKTSPTGIINLAEATEPQTDGPNKFYFTANGHKHSFKASSKAEADNWVAQLKLKRTEGKELADTVTETEAYKVAFEDYQPTPPKKEEEKPVEEALKAVEEPAKEEPAAEEPAKAVEEPAKEEPKAVEEPKEEPKRRSLSRKRASYINALFSKKEKKDEKPVEAAAPAAEDKAVEPAAEAPVVAEAKPVEEAPVAEAPAAAKVSEEKAVEEAPKATSPKEKPATNKRNSSFFGLLKKDKKPEAEAAAPVAPAKDAEAPAASSDAAPVIPPVETSAPLATEAAAPAEAPAAEAPAVAPATNGDSKKEVKSEKRKSSLPFLGKKDKAVVTSDEEGEKPKSPNAFSRIRATIKGRGKSATEKSEEKPAEDKTVEEKPAEEKAVVAEPAEASKAVEEPENKPEVVAPAAAPGVTAAA